ncbi:hypothetical protein MTR_8g079330 [Medicago truncatula]|uniref:Uncharacterized protein n=1 Tax=Medicago truncatula TaxID=3880 RepID=G7LFN7_MEDTR|nr:hypothetical protein MTR_8g079330 [Medicago truncatula]
MLTLASLGWYLVEQGIPQGNPEALLVWSTFDSERVELIMFHAHSYKVLGVKGRQLMSLVRARWVARYEIPSRGGPQCCLDNNLRES